MGIKAYYANRQLVNSSLISRNSKLQIYRTSVRPVVTCGSESWTLTVGNTIGNTNNNNKCIKEKIMMGNKACYANRQLVNSSLISRNNKLQIYRMMVRPAVTCGSESWTLTVEEERELAVFERKILRKIYGPMKENEIWRIRRNDELEAIIKGGGDMVRFIKCQRIR